MIIKVWNKIVLFVLVIGWGVVSIASAQADEVDRYIQQLKDNNREIRAEAAKALGELGNPRAIDPLIPLLKDEDGWVREHAKKR